MSFLKNWKLILASLSLALFTACAGSSGGSSDEGGYEQGGSGGSGKAAVQKEKIDVKELTAGETGGLALKTASKIDLQIGDRLKFFTRESKKRTL